MDGDIFAENVAVSDAAIGALALVFHVLGFVTDDDAGVQRATFTDLRPAGEKDVVI